MFFNCSDFALKISLSIWKPIEKINYANKWIKAVACNEIHNNGQV